MKCPFRLMSFVLVLTVDCVVTHSIQNESCRACMNKALFNLSILEGTRRGQASNRKMKSLCRIRHDYIDMQIYFLQ